MLIQEELASTPTAFYPWWVLVASVLLNRTTGDQVRAVLPTLMKRCPGPRSMAGIDPVDLSTIIESCGMSHVKSKRLVKLAEAWETWNPYDTPVETLPGCGQYAADSWRVFVQGDLSRLPRDGHLAAYVRRRRRVIRDLGGDYRVCRDIIWR